MVLLALESAHLFGGFLKITEGNLLQYFFIQFTHHDWNGLRFWDLIQPGFMFIAGTAMAFSLHKQNEAGDFSMEDPVFGIEFRRLANRTKP